MNSSFSFLANALACKTSYEELVDDSPQLFDSYPKNLTLTSAKKIIEFSKEYTVDQRVVDFAQSFLDNATSGIIPVVFFSNGVSRFMPIDDDEEE